MQKLDFEKVVFTSKKPEFMIFDMLPKRPVILFCAVVIVLGLDWHLYWKLTSKLILAYM